jgi:hypothetical protein
MALFRNENDVETIKNACPICHSDVKGSDVYLYYCQKCNVLYNKDELVLDKRVVDNLVKEKVVGKFDKEKDKLKIEETLKPKEISEKKKAILEDVKKAKKYYISRKSNILHVSNCPYGKNIKKENKITLRSLEGTEKLKKCRCFIDT